MDLEPQASVGYCIRSCTLKCLWLYTHAFAWYVRSKCLSEMRKLSKYTNLHGFDDRYAICFAPPFSEVHDISNYFKATTLKDQIGAKRRLKTGFCVTTSTVELLKLCAYQGELMHFPTSVVQAPL